MHGFDFKSWLHLSSPEMTWDWPHQIYLYERLRKITTGECKRLMIFMPPRHSKTETVSVRYSAYMLKRNPKLNIILGSYNQKLANRISRRVRRVIENKVELSKERCAAEEWETKQGGGVRAVGVGAGVTGFGAGLIIIDDPVKGRAHAESTAFRETCLDWFNDDIYTRQEPGAAIILIQTRWHDDDLAGHLLKEMKEPGGEKWEVVSLPALAEGEAANLGFGISDCGLEEKINPESKHATPSAETAATPPDSGGELKANLQSEGEAGSPKSKVQGPKSEESPKSQVPKVPSENSRNRKVRSESTPSRLGTPETWDLRPDPLGRQPGQALCPERYDEEALHRIRTKLGAYSFSALFQQNPIPAEGGLFNRKWFGKDKIVARTPDLARWARGYDLAVSTRTSADYTASFRCGFDSQGNLFIADGFRKRIEYPEQRRYVVERMTMEKKTQHGIEKALHGQAFVQDLRQIPAVRGVAFKAVKVDADKYTRALAWANLAEEGRVYLVQGPWIDDFLEEVCRFTGRGDTHDDQVDAVSLAVGLLKRPGGKLFTW